MEIIKTVEEYNRLREELVEKNGNFLGVVLRDKEKKLDHYLKAIVEECKTVSGGKIPLNDSLLKNSYLWRTKLYSFCKMLPKGADLHVHGTAQLPMWKLIRFIYDHEKLVIDPDTFILHNADENSPGCITLREALDEGIIDRPTLERKWTLLGVENGKDVWQYFEELFIHHCAIDEDESLLYDFYVMGFEDNVKNGIFHIELHVLLSDVLEDTLRTVGTIRKAYYETRKKYPFFTVRIIGSGMKMLGHPIAESRLVLENTLKARELIKDESDSDNIGDFVVGFDLVNEEDTCTPLSEYVPMLIRIKNENPDFQYFLHSGESLQSHNDNLIDAYLLGTKRVGHGMNLYRYPDLLRRYVSQEICLECCPISNQMLGYTHDIRLHPGAEYLKRGVTVALCSDDPVYMEHEELTDDFFVAIAAWGLGVAEIKQLCINSIRYSALDEKRKRDALRFWHEKWNRFVDKMTDE